MRSAGRGACDPDPASRSAPQAFVRSVARGGPLGRQGLDARTALGAYGPAASRSGTHRDREVSVEEVRQYAERAGIGETGEPVGEVLSARTYARRSGRGSLHGQIRIPED